MTSSTVAPFRGVNDEPRRRLVAVCRRRRARTGGVAAVLGVAVLSAFAVSLAVGELNVPLTHVYLSLTGQGEATYEFIVNDVRAPRAVTATLVGTAFGLSGAIFQTLVRNPLASPDIIGITTGASAAAVTAIVVFGVSGSGLSLVAVVGALATAAGIYVMAWRGGVTGGRLVLVGIAVAAMLWSLISYLLTRSRVFAAQDALHWLTGSLNDQTWSTAVPLMVSLAVLLPLTVGVARPLRALQLGDDSAAALGTSVETSRLLLILVAAGLAAVATAAAGPVEFVAFVSAPIARRLVGSGGAALVPSALVGALVVLLADLVGQHAFDVNYPVGVVTGIVGAPYLIFLLVGPTASDEADKEHP